MFAFEGRRRAEGARKRKRERRKRSRIRERGKPLYPGWVLAPFLNAAQTPPPPLKGRKKEKEEEGGNAAVKWGPFGLLGETARRQASFFLSAGPCGVKNRWRLPVFSFTGQKAAFHCNQNAQLVACAPQCLW